MTAHDPAQDADAAYVDPRVVLAAPPQDDVRDEIARIIDPHSWMLRERALMPYREGRGAHQEENWLYEVTWRWKGHRTADEVDAWLRTGEPLFEDHTHTFHLRFQDSIRRADAVLAMLRERGMTT